MTRTLVFGGARSGKSAYAEKLAEESGKAVIYVATAQAGDREMAARIARHRDDRNPEWTTVEEPLALGQTIAQWSSADRLVLVECLTLWLSNLLFAEETAFPEGGDIAPPAGFTQQRALLLQSLEHAAGDVILVSNEVGMGVVPHGAISRWFVDEAGRLNQEIAKRCERVFWVAAGLPLALKGQG
jgi:adenosylcobinamide kinase/adenosylcobinamide-phosphate guanylyltransferase